MFGTILKYFQLAVSVFLIISILVQNRSSGLSATFGGGGTIHVKKRGAEKVLFNATIILAVLFVASAILALFIR